VPEAAENGGQDVAHVGVLGQHDAGERRANQRLLDRHIGRAQVGLGDPDLGSQRGERRGSLVVAGHRRVDLGKDMKLRCARSRARFSASSALDQFGLALGQVRLGRLHAGGGLLALRPHVAAFQPRDHVALDHPLTFLHRQPLQPAGSFCSTPDA